MNNGLSLKNRNIVYVKEPIKDGFIFKKANFAKDWDSVYVYPENLHRGTVSIGMRKITQPLLVLASHSAKMAYIVASEENPVYVPFCFENTKGRNFFMLFQLLPHVLPDYLFYLSKYSSWIPITMHIEQNEILGNPGWNEVGSQIVLPEILGGYDTITAEDIFYSGLSDNPIIIPELDVQKQRIADAKSVEIMLQEKVQEKETRYVRMEWLNEAHIRNCKHRLSNDMFPLRMAIDRLYNFFVKNPEGVKLSDIIGIRTKNTVDKLFNGIKESIEKVSNEIEYLTQSEDIEKKKERINVAKELNNYLEKKESKFSTVSFDVRKIGFDSDLQIEIAKEAFTELLDNIIDNAVRHGFVEQRDDYIIEVSIEVTENDMCRISIANNGRPMSERAIKTYFECGSSAGDTSHTGFGGARIYSICDKMGGKALDPSSKEGFPVVISVEFPIVEVD